MLKIGGITRCTSIDYPDELSAVIFCQGCPWHCIYCQNRHLISAEQNESAPEWEQIIGFLEKRRQLLGAVVFSGGEPTMQKDIVGAAAEIRSMGFRIGIHTAGPCPETVGAFLPYLDWIGMDIKAPFAEYPLITNVQDSGVPAAISADMIRKSGISHQFRTTVHPLLLEEDRLERIRQLVTKEWRSSLTEQRLNTFDLLTTKNTEGEKNGRNWIDG